jgi:hypothetical protein
MLTRRTLGRGALALALAAFATGAGAALRRRFLFLHAEGGWDPLCVFAPLFGVAGIDMEADATPLTVGAFPLVGSPGRPSVAPFFERWGSRTLLLNGLSTRSVNHEACQAIALTGSSSDNEADWATLLAAADADAYFLPHLVMNGPSFAGGHTILVSRAEGRIEDAVHGSILQTADYPLAAPSDLARALVDDRLAGRAAAIGSAPIARDYGTALERSRALSEIRERVTFPPVYDFRGRATNAIRLLADGLSRCATVSTDFVWDSHGDNSEQTPLFEALFTDLDAIMDTLANTPDATGKMLADDTVVVVLSEMARTPAYNDTHGRDHWPYTSVMIIGNGVTGGRVVGGYDDKYTGIGIDPASGEPGAHLPNVEILSGVLS